MYAIIGLGNPEKKYDKTRHNIGFDVIDELASQMGVQVNTKRHKALCGVGQIGSEKVILVKPQTYMNLSGETLIDIYKYYKVDLDNIIVIYDDMDLEPGNIKVRIKGGPGSHNGMKSVVSNINSEDFVRVRVGIGKPENKSDMINYVIGHVSEDEYKILEEGTSLAKDATIEIIKNDVNSSMNKFNAKTR